MTYEDTQGRRIKIEVIDPDDVREVRALHGPEQIGKLEFEYFPELADEPILSHASVDEPYQKCGIGTEMVRQAVQALEHFRVPGYGWHGRRDDGLHLSEEGAALITRCMQLGILDKSYYVDAEEAFGSEGDD